MELYAAAGQSGGSGHPFPSEGGATGAGDVQVKVSEH